MNSFDLLFTSVSPSNDLTPFLSSCSPINKKSSSPLTTMDPTSLMFSNNDIYTTSSSPMTTNQSRSSTRLRQLLATKSPPSITSSPSQTLHYHSENKSHSNAFDDLIQVAESPTTTHVSPSSNDLPSPTKRRRNHSQTNGIHSNTKNSADMLLKQILGRQPPITSTLSLPNTSDINTSDNNSVWSSPGSVPLIKTESVTSDDSTSGGQTTNTSGGTNKLRSDIFLRVSNYLSTSRTFSFDRTDLFAFTSCLVQSCKR
jgi:hypothetical protein